MGVSLIYNVKKENVFSYEERKMIDSVVQKYKIVDVDKIDWRGENIESPEYSEPTVFEGCIGIGYYEEDYEREIEEVVRWCYCLSDIYKQMKQCKWLVCLGDEKLIYNEQVGFKLEKIPVSLHEYLKPVLK